VIATFSSYMKLFVPTVLGVTFDLVIVTFLSCMNLFVLTVLGVTLSQGQMLTPKTVRTNRFIQEENVAITRSKVTPRTVRTNRFIQEENIAITRSKVPPPKSEYFFQQHWE
jgi:hypothetical protein